MRTAKELKELAASIGFYIDQADLVPYLEAEVEHLKATLTRSADEIARLKAAVSNLEGQIAYRDSVAQI